MRAGDDRRFRTDDWDAPVTCGMLGEADPSTSELGMPLEFGCDWCSPSSLVSDVGDLGHSMRAGEEARNCGNLC